MFVDIELVRRADGHYVARTLHIPAVTVEAPTREVALQRIRTMLIERRNADVEVVRLEIDDAEIL